MAANHPATGHHPPASHHAHNYPPTATVKKHSIHHHASHDLATKTSHHSGARHKKASLTVPGHIVHGGVPPAAATHGGHHGKSPEHEVQHITAHTGHHRHHVHEPDGSSVDSAGPDVHGHHHGGLHVGSSDPHRGSHGGSPGPHGGHGHPNDIHSPNVHHSSAHESGVHPAHASHLGHHNFAIPHTHDAHHVGHPDPTHPAHNPHDGTHGANPSHGVTHHPGGHHKNSLSNHPAKHNYPDSIVHHGRHNPGEHPSDGHAHGGHSHSGHADSRHQGGHEHSHHEEKHSISHKGHSQLHHDAGHPERPSCPSCVPDGGLVPHGNSHEQVGHHDHHDHHLGQDPNGGQITHLNHHGGHHGSTHIESLGHGHSTHLGQGHHDGSIVNFNPGDVSHRPPHVGADDHHSKHGHQSSGEHNGHSQLGHDIGNHNTHEPKGHHGVHDNKGYQSVHEDKGHHSHHSGHHDESARKHSEHAELLLNNYDHFSKVSCSPVYLDLATTRSIGFSKPWTPRHMYSGRDANKSPLSNLGATPVQNGSSTERLQECLELELSRRRHCEKMIGSIQTTLLEANEEVVAMAEQSKRREKVLTEKEEKIRIQELENRNMENFLRKSLEETGVKFRNLFTEHDLSKTEWRNAECGYTEKVAELENRVRSLREELRGSKHRLSEFEEEKQKVEFFVKEAEQELCRMKSCHQAEKSRLDGAKRDYKKRINELTIELDDMKKYADSQERKCNELENRLSRLESQLDGAIRSKTTAEREFTKKSAMQQTNLHEITRSLRAEYDAKMAENEKQCRKEIEKVTNNSMRKTEQEMEKIREEIRFNFEEKIARIKVDFKLKESNYENQVVRLVEKMRQYEIRLEEIVKDKEREHSDVRERQRELSDVTTSFKTELYERSSSPPTRSSKDDWRNTYEKYTNDYKWKSNYNGSHLRDSTFQTLNSTKKLLDDNSISSRRFVIHGTYTPRRSPKPDDCADFSADSDRRSRSMRRSHFS